MGQTLGTATGGAFDVSGGGAGAASASGASSLTCAASWAGDGAVGLGGGSFTARAARRTKRPGGGLRIGSPETDTGWPSYHEPAEGGGGGSKRQTDQAGRG